MINDIINIFNPLPYYEGTVDFFFPQQNDEIVLSRDEKRLIVDQINNVTKHLNSAKHNISKDNFDEAIEDVERAINESTCGKCKKRMLIAAYDINHASNVCDLDEGRCTGLKTDINTIIEDFVNNYLPRVEEVLSAREN